MTTQSSLLSLKGKSDLEVRLEEVSAYQVVARVGKANRALESQPGLGGGERPEGPSNPVSFCAKSGK